ncbi:hypothetical protein RRG08_059333 [Elysia crispata]|uniref:Uncharacterized protein n=1 Tax=Elysia crispata TaxID=231223 RepID=A0AAE1BDY6_9GAST|nr:hypothetical protein RRG08_059333 [Elysia crispata]
MFVFVVVYKDAKTKAALLRTDNSFPTIAWVDEKDEDLVRVYLSPLGLKKNVSQGFGVAAREPRYRSFRRHGSADDNSLGQTLGGYSCEYDVIEEFRSFPILRAISTAQIFVFDVRVCLGLEWRDGRETRHAD